MVPKEEAIMVGEGRAWRPTARSKKLKELISVYMQEVETTN